MIVGSIKENLSLEKRVSITPETAKNIISPTSKKDKDYTTTKKQGRLGRGLCQTFSYLF